jgi:hypothetical protein
LSVLSCDFTRFAFFLIFASGIANVGVASSLSELDLFFAFSKSRLLIRR